MINKQNLWFITLFSLILILGIYYVSIGDEVASVFEAQDNINEKQTIEISPSDILVALEVENEEEKQALMEEYQDILLNTSTSISDKNDAYENIQKIQDYSKDEEKIKKKINDEFKLKAFVKKKDNTINVVVIESKHNNELANKIIRSVQSLYNDEKYITVKFNN